MKMPLFYLLFIISFSNGTAQNIDYRIPGTIPLIKQPKNMDCWITVATMLKSWKNHRIYSVDEFANELGNPWKLYYEKNSGLSFEEQERFISTIGLKSEPPANYMLEAYLDLLQEYGPLWITTGDGFNAHARILIGCRGDGSYEHSNFIIIDPSIGREIQQNALEFVLEFETEARIADEDNWERLRIQIHHY
jgi:hypothetical protein